MATGSSQSSTRKRSPRTEGTSSSKKYVLDGGAGEDKDNRWRINRRHPLHPGGISDAHHLNLRCYHDAMRTTIRLDPEVAAAAERLRRKRHIGLGEAVNELARAGLAQKKMPTRFRQRTADVGLKVDVTDIASTLELLDQSDAEGTR